MLENGERRFQIIFVRYEVEHQESRALAERAIAAQAVAATRWRVAVEHAAGQFCALASPRKMGKNVVMELSADAVALLVKSSREISDDFGQALIPDFGKKSPLSQSSSVCYCVSVIF